MCGIVGYAGERQAQTILFDCLSRLEYRGYDSSGVAIRGSTIHIAKDKVRVAALQAASPSFQGTTGIGHTRWATHGAPSMLNAHPHMDCKGKIAVVHNGVITNYLKLKGELIREGHVFLSETDTEVISHLIEKYCESDLVKAVETALQYLEGSYAIGVISEFDERLVVARRDSPLIIGLGDGENFVASDVPALIEYTNRIMCLENGDVGVVSKNGINIRREGSAVLRQVETINWADEDRGKCGYEHFMLKEIHEEPKVIWNSLSVDLPEETKLMFSGPMEHTVILACGTSYHAAMIGKHVLEELLGTRVVVELASEFNYRNHVSNSSRAILISQSGETADVLNAMKKLQNAKVPTLVITNAAHSTACRTASQVICTQAGPEVSVAATKSFIAQVVILLRLALAAPNLEPSVRTALSEKIRELPFKVQRILQEKNKIAECAGYISNYNNAFFIGRGINFPVALEGALKLKEISYIHAEGYAAGELKHGPLALMSWDTPVVAIVAADSTYDAMMTNIKEVKARGAPVIMVTSSEINDVDLADEVIRLNTIDPILSPVVNSVCLQLLAYYAALVKGCPIDFPRNLAKSVTVE